MSENMADPKQVKAATRVENSQTTYSHSQNPVFSVYRSYLGFNTTPLFLELTLVISVRGENQYMYVMVKLSCFDTFPKQTIKSVLFVCVLSLDHREKA